MKTERILKRTLAALLALGMLFGTLPALSEEETAPEAQTVIIVVSAPKETASRDRDAAEDAAEAPDRPVPAGAQNAGTAEAPAEAGNTFGGADNGNGRAEYAADPERTETPAEAGEAVPEEAAEAPAKEAVEAEPDGAGESAESEHEEIITEPAEAEPETEEAPAEAGEAATEKTAETPAEETVEAEPDGAEVSAEPEHEEIITEPAEAEPETEEAPAEPASEEAAETTEKETEETEPEDDPFGSGEEPLPGLGTGTEAAGNGSSFSVTGVRTRVGSGEITAISRETVNGYTTLHFTIDGRYEGILCGLDPDTTEEEALAIAEGAARQLYGTPADSFSVADSASYTGFRDTFGVLYGEAMASAAEYDSALKTETNEAKRELILELLIGAYYDVCKSAQGSCYAAYKAWAKDPENAELRAALEAEMAAAAAAAEAEYEETRGYAETNAVFEGQTSLIDAEKTSFANYFLPEGERDSNLCWAASAADMLWYTGWGAQAVNPLTGENFTSEDELLAWFAAAFSNKGAKQNTGVQYVFKGITPDAAALGYAAPQDGYLDKDSPYALLAEYCADLLVTVTEKTNDPSAVAATLDALETGAGVGLSLYDAGYLGGHAVTAFGRIVDLRSGDPADALRAVFIADSDSDVPYLSEAEFRGGLTEDGQAAREDRTNAYTMLRTSVYTDPYSLDSAILLYDYGKLMAGTTVLAPYTEDTAEEVRETDSQATLNAANTPDLVPVNLAVATDGNHAAGQTKFDEGDVLVVMLRVQNESAAALPANQEIPVEFTVLRVNAKTGEVGEVVRTLEATYDYAVGANKKVTEIWELGSELAPGTYVVELTGLNGDHTVTEAYYVNNLCVDGYVFTIIAIPVPHAEKTKETKDGAWRVKGTVLDPSEPAYIPIRASDGKGGAKAIHPDTGGAVLWYGSEMVDPVYWSIAHAEDGTALLVLEPEYLLGLEPGEHEFRLECRGCRILFTITIAPPLT